MVADHLCELECWHCVLIVAADVLREVPFGQLCLPLFQLSLLLCLAVVDILLF
jgi:hypothetical protein